MEKLNMQTTDVVDENIKRIGEMFPNCLTEVKDEKGRPQVAIDFDQLRQRIMGSVQNDVHPNYSRTAAVPLQSHPSAACSHRSFRVILLVPSAYPPDRNHVAY